jgi:hypothetical protein
MNMGIQRSLTLPQRVHLTYWLRILMIWLHNSIVFKASQFPSLGAGDLAPARGLIGDSISACAVDDDRPGPGFA